MRILIVTQFFPPFGALPSSSSLTRLVVQHLKSIGCVPTVLCTWYGHHEPTLSDSSVYGFLEPKKSATRSAFDAEAEAARIRHVLVESKPDQIWLFKLWGIEPLPLLALLRDYGCPLSLHLGDECIRLHVFRWSGPRLLETVRFSRVVYNSTGLFRRTPRLAYLRDDSCALLCRTPINRVFFREESNARACTSGHRALRLVYVGRTVRRKQVEALFPVVVGMLRSQVDVDLSIIGSGHQKEYLQRLRDMPAAMGIDGNIHWLGTRTQDQLSALMDSFDALVFPPSLIDDSISTEGLPAVICEAFAARLPIFAAASPGVAEIVRHNETGWLLDYSDPDSAAQTIAECLQSRSVHSVLDKAHNWVREHCRVELLCDAMNTL